MSYEILPSQPNGGGRRYSAGHANPGEGPYVEVGAFRQGNELSQWMLARYLVSRVVGDYIAKFLLVAGLVVLALSIVVYVNGAQLFGVLVGLVAVGLLLTRGALQFLLQRLAGAQTIGATEVTMRRLVRESRGDVQRELRRIGVPSRSFTVPLLAVRLISRRRRAATLQRLRRFEIERAVSPAHLDALHLALSPGAPG
ncbi:hypothetical protein SAMN05892883_3488 [Jatrophihabitans sp. GAS493]|uniref:hypothetical protein n=1 Tax=Jatrophihabitans sp. GAS493 TaxID=1907575 RepID=UPI000BB86013|nr:hypothetical protein [Jatrophihabitans sp. GAS493]SOD74305.1 hypothetical protein SAMN05892883_3488 [Jatrophihabitans sp. GAS493]